MEEFIDLEPVELNDDELAAVVGGFTVMVGTNSNITNSINNSGNITLTNSSIGSNSTVG